MRLHNRNINIDIWSDTVLIKNINSVGRLLYIGLWLLANNSGYIEKDLFAFKIHLFPGDKYITEENLSHYIDQLIEIGKLSPEERDGQPYLYIKDFPTTNRKEPEETKNAIKHYLNHINATPSKTAIQILGSYLDDGMEDALIIQVIDKARDDNKGTWSYIQRTLQNLLESGVKTLEQYNGQEEAYKKRKQVQAKPSEAFPEDSLEYRYSQMFWNLLQQNTPGLKEPNIQEWAAEFYNILQVDRRAQEELFEVINFAVKDSFWKKNIINPVDLKKHFDRLKVQKDAHVEELIDKEERN